MSRYPNSSIGRRLMLAALVGSVCGAAAGAWSIERGAAVRQPAAAYDAAIRHEPVRAFPVRLVQDVPKAEPAAAAPPASMPPPVSKTTNAGAPDVLLRARGLAQRADVKALVALRDDLVRQAEERGETGSPSSKQQLEEFDRYLAEARWLRLKLDAEAFKQAEAGHSR